MQKTEAEKLNQKNKVFHLKKCESSLGKGTYFVKYRQGPYYLGVSREELLEIKSEIERVL